MVRFWAQDSNGKDLGILSQSASKWGRRKLQASLQTFQAPATIKMKLITERKDLEFPFELKDIPLAHHSEMPEKLEALSFTGHKSPIEVHFVALKERDTNFPKADLRTINHSNKDALLINTQFIYLDGSGKELKRFPNSLNGAFTSKGQEPVAAKGAKKDMESAAFFMPKETQNIRVIIDSVKFVDGTVWESKN